MEFFFFFKETHHMELGQLLLIYELCGVIFNNENYHIFSKDVYIT